LSTCVSTEGRRLTTGLSAQVLAVGDSRAVRNHGPRIRRSQNKQRNSAPRASASPPGGRASFHGLPSRLRTPSPLGERWRIEAPQVSRTADDAVVGAGGGHLFFSLVESKMVLTEFAGLQIWGPPNHRRQDRACSRAELRASIPPLRTIDRQKPPTQKGRTGLWPSKSAV
jgi:hypothetical protein